MQRVQDCNGFQRADNRKISNMDLTLTLSRLPSILTCPKFDDDSDDDDATLIPITTQMHEKLCTSAHILTHDIAVGHLLTQTYWHVDHL